MLTTQECIEAFGVPAPAKEPEYMTLWKVPADIREAIPAVPAKIYCNKAMPVKLEFAFRNLIEAGVSAELETFDGCFNVRNIRGGVSWSKHSWGLAVDLNAETNGLGQEPTLSIKFVKSFTDAGFVWGGGFSRKDGMHFELKAIF